ncbi:MAG: hypothetical protein QOF88_6469 [Mycobacterium sp.]|nr:hypothetical protein [Mycobacterium sp.]
MAVLAGSFGGGEPSERGRRCHGALEHFWLAGEELVVLGVHDQCRGDDAVGDALERVCRCAPDEVGVGRSAHRPHSVVESPPDLRLRTRFQRHESVGQSAAAGEDHLHHRGRDRVAVGLMHVEDSVVEDQRRAAVVKRRRPRDEVGAHAVAELGDGFGVHAGLLDGEVDDRAQHVFPVGTKRQSPFADDGSLSRSVIGQHVVAAL